MTRDEGTSAWYRKQRQQPKFVTPDGFSVQAISLDGVAQYQIKRGSYRVAEVKTIAEVAQYVDLSDLKEVAGAS